MPKTVTVEKFEPASVLFHVCAVDTFNSPYCVFHGTAEAVHSFLAQHNYKRIEAGTALEGDYTQQVSAYSLHGRSA